MWIVSFSSAPLTRLALVPLLLKCGEAGEMWNSKSLTSTTIVVLIAFGWGRDASTLSTSVLWPFRDPPSR